MDRSTQAAGTELFLAREKLVETWMTRVRADVRISSSLRLRAFELRDYVPRFIDVVTEVLRANVYAGDMRERAGHIARVHALERRCHGFTIEEVQRELDHLEELVADRVRESAAAHRLVGTAIAEARQIAEEAYATPSGMRWKEERPTAMLAKTFAEDEHEDDEVTAVNGQPRNRVAS